MEFAGIISVGIIAIMWFVATIAGITRHDIEVINRNKQIRRHPHLRKYRHRPLISVIFENEPTEAARIAVEKSSYKKREIVKSGSLIKGDLILNLSKDTVVTKHAIRDAVRQIQDNPDRPYVEIVPIVKVPQTLHGFFATFSLIMGSPFVYVRSGLGIVNTPTSWPTLTTKEYYQHSRQVAWVVAKWIASVANLLALTYLSYIGVVLAQPEFLLLYLLAFCIWTFWVITGHSTISGLDKIVLLILMPATIGYFVIRAIIGSISIFRLFPILMTHRAVVS